MTAKQTLGSTRDSAFMAITEVMGLAGDAMAANTSEALLVITLSGNNQTAVLGGTLTAERIEVIEGLLSELKRRAVTEGDGDKVLHVWR